MNGFLTAYLALMRKILPRAEGKASLGLDMGGHSCKLVELTWDGSQFLLKRCAIEPISAGGLEKTLASILQKSPPNISPVTALFGRGTLVRFVEFPRMSLDELKKSFQLEADKYFPFPVDQIYTDCFILDTKSAGKRMPVLAVAAKKDLVDQRIQLLNKLGFSPEVITLNPVAVSNVVEAFGIPQGESESAGQVPPETPAALLDIGETVSSLLVFHHQRPVFHRDIYTGGRDFTKSVMNAKGIAQFEEAEAFKCAPPSNEDAVSLWETTAARLVSELRMSLDYFSTENNASVDVLVLSGGGAYLPGLKEYISQNLEVTCVLWNPMAKLAVADGVDLDEVKAASPRLGVALGLALIR